MTDWLRFSNPVPRGNAHVLFHYLPIGEKFTHKGERYVKTGDEEAHALDPANVTRDGGREWVFEGHYGAVISEARARELRLPAEAYWDN